MNPLSWPVLVGTLLVGSPALWASQVDGTLSPDVALVRLLVCAVGVWVAVSLVVELAESASRSNVVPEEIAVEDPPDLP
ncbi:MAG: hypothetical protein JWN91_766 [Nocardioides sp.]|nr:hypothetical protein [Nocardioides sp.]